MEWINIGKNIIHYNSLKEFLKLYLIVKTKIIATFYIVFNVCRRNANTNIFKKWRG